MKYCPKCRQNKDFEEFFKNARSKDGHQCKCKECFKLSIDRKRAKDLSKKWRIENPDKCKIHSKKSQIKKLYNLTLPKYEELINNNSCSICSRSNNLCIDHCHQTGKIRGILCRSCNCALGFFKDDIDILKNAISYLDSNK